MVLLDIDILQKEKLIGSRALTPNVCPCQPPHSESPDVQTPADWMTLFRQLVPIQHTHEATAVTEEWPQCALGLWGLSERCPCTTRQLSRWSPPTNSWVDGWADRQICRQTHRQCMS